MKLASLFVATFGAGVILYPVVHIPGGGVFFAEGGGKQAEPAPVPEKTKTDFAMLNQTDEVNFSQNDKDYQIIINIPATKLTLYENGRKTLEFPVAVGQPIYKTPVGLQEIKRIEWNPWWYPPDAEWAKDEKITPPGPKNPLGPVKMPMSEDIRLHGTIKDNSIGTAASHGCIRMHSKDAITLAWYLQSHLTDKNEPALLQKYKKHGSTTFYVKLDKAVPVTIVYDTIDVSEEVLIIYPDIYNKVRDVKALAQWKLFNSGINPWEFDLNKMPKASRTPQKVDLQDIH